MEGIARLEPFPQKFLCFGLCCRGIDRQPFGGKASSPLEAPRRVGRGNPLSYALASEVPEQPSAHYLADLRFVIRDQVTSNAVHHLGNPFLPLLIPRGHLDLAARQADHRSSVGGTGNGDG